MHRHRISKTKVNIKKDKTSLSATDSVADLLALYIAMVDEDIHTGVIANILSHSKKKFNFLFFFFFLKHLKWAGSSYKRQERTNPPPGWHYKLRGRHAGLQNTTVKLIQVTQNTSNVNHVTRKKKLVAWWQILLFELFQLSRLTQNYSENHGIKNKITKFLFFSLSLQTNIETLC